MDARIITLACQARASEELGKMQTGIQAIIEEAQSRTADPEEA